MLFAIVRDTVAVISESYPIDSMQRVLIKKNRNVLGIGVK